MRHRLLSLALLAIHSSALSDDLPNIVIVLADDMGWGDPQCYQADSKIPTPSIDRLAAEGLRFTDAHTPSSVCTPTRYTLLTGRYAWRTRLKSGVLDGFDTPLIGDEDTLAKMLSRAGYRTHCLGKWHLGLQWTKKAGNAVVDRDVSKGFRQGLDVDFTKPFSGGPLDVGFDTFFGISASLDMSPYCWLRDDRVVQIPEIETPENRDGMFMNQVPGLTTDDFDLAEVLPRLGAETAKIVRAAADDDTPFFCYVPLTSPHLPVVNPPESKGKSAAGEYGDFVVATDNALGEILKALDETDQAEDTFLLFTSDNGGLFHWWDFRAADDGGKAPKTKRGEEVRQFGHQSNADWRGTKADIFEGGHRVPFLIRWPKRAAAGRVIDVTV
ncbi:MAG: arylsulfatase, partial [Verrucomicrobiota bacterium]